MFALFTFYIEAHLSYGLSYGIGPWAMWIYANAGPKFKPGIYFVFLSMVLQANPSGIV